MRYNKYKKMSMNKLRQEIAKEIDIFNTNYAKYSEKMASGKIKTEFQQFTRKKEELQAYVGVARGNNLGLGKGYTKMFDKETETSWSVMTDRDKAIEFLKDIHMTNAWDVYTDAGRKKWKNARKKGYETYVTDKGEISRKDYDKLIDLYNNLGSRILERYGSDQIKHDYDTYAKQYGIDRETFGNIVRDVVDNSKGMQQHQMSDEVAERIAKLFNPEETEEETEEEE